jgi:hypothetical protein
MAPEQLDERAPVTSAADVFAWGSVMAFAGTGRQPFGNGLPAELRHRILRQPPDLEGLDPILRPIVEAAMRKDPATRPTAIQLRERLKAAARAANDTDGRDTIVADVLRSAEEQSDGRRLGGPVGWPEAPQHDYPPLRTALVVLLLVGFAMAVWFHQPGRLGGFVDDTTRWLFGLGAWVMPLVAVAWAAGLPRRRHGMRTFWLLARAVKRNPRPGLILRALWSSVQAMVRSARGGPTAVLVAGLGLLHVARGTPPLNASRFELQQSSGVLGGSIPDLLVYLVNKPPAVVLLLLILAGGTIAVFLRIDHRWGRYRQGRQAAVAAALACLLAATVPAWYLKDHHYPLWVAFDGDRVAVLHGLSDKRSGRWRPTRTTNVSRAVVPAALYPQLERGIPVDSLDDGLQLANRLANAYRQAPSQAYHDQSRTLTVGTCLDDVQTRSPVPCTRPHGAEVYGIVTAPYPSVPPTQPLDEFSDGACDALFESYVGIRYDQSMLSYERLGPTADQWEHPDARAVACLAQPALSSVVRRSLHGSREIVEDDFTDQSNWDTYDNDNCTIEYGDDALHLQKKEPGGVCVGTPETTRIDPSTVKEAEVSIAITWDTGSPADAKAGLICRSAGDQNLYEFVVTRKGAYSIEKVVEGNWTTLKQGRKLGVVQPDAPTRLRASCSGGDRNQPVKLALWANDQLLAKATDSKDTLPSGTVGVVVDAPPPVTFGATFDNIVVRAPTAG